MLRESDQQPCDAKEHQGRSDAFERQRDYTGGGDPSYVFYSTMMVTRLTPREIVPPIKSAEVKPTTLI
jgi:hypothetical protein